MTRARFPKAIKTMRMLAMYYECQGELMKAQEILLELISEDPTDNQSLKRLVALYRDMEMES
jgi:DNA-binding SARP family transcriptional activator